MKLNLQTLLAAGLIWAGSILSACSSERLNAITNPDICLTDKGMAKWSGQCKLGYAEGLGTATFEDNIIESMSGDFRKGSPVSKVKIIYSGGGTYEGTLLDGKFHGFGLHRESWGNGYEGNWLEDFQHGEGIYIHEDGTRTPGVWRSGVGLVQTWYSDPETQCMVSIAPNSNPIGEAQWAGECINGKASGHGTITWTNTDDPPEHADNVTFTGNLVDGIIQGEGQWISNHISSNVTNETTITATWLDGEVSGKGQKVSVRKYAPNDLDHFDTIVRTYVGEFSLGEYSGEGRLEEVKHHSNGDIETLIQSGVFSEGFLNGRGIKTRQVISQDEILHFTSEEGQFLDRHYIGDGHSSTTISSGNDRYISKIDYSAHIEEGGFGEIEYANGDRFRGHVDSFGVPLNGYCLIKKSGFDGPCEIKNTMPSEGYFKSCLVLEKKQSPCLKVVRQIAH